MEQDDVDSFTQQLLQRTKARQQNLDKKVTRGTSSSSSNGSRKRPSPLRTENIPADEKQHSEMREKSPLKKKVSFKTRDKICDESKENEQRESVNLKTKLTKLARLHSEEVLDSPPPKPQRLYPDLSPFLNPETNTQSQTPKTRINRLASLAETYKQIEEEPISAKIAKAPKKPPRDETPDTRTPLSKPLKSTPTFSQVLEKFQTPTNKQAQGFVHSPSNSKLEYEFNKNGQKQQKVEENRNFRVPAPPPPPLHKAESVEKKPQRNDSLAKKPLQQNPQEKTFSPARDIPRFDIQLRSTSTEKTPVKSEQPSKNPKVDPSILPLSARVALFEQATHDEAQAAAANRVMIGMISAKKSPQKTPQKAAVNAVSPHKTVGKATETIQRQLKTHSEDWKKNEIISKTKSERRNDMHLLLNRWEQATAIIEGDELGIQRKPSSSNSHHRLSKESVTSSELEPMGSLESTSDADDESTEEEVFVPRKSSSKSNIKLDNRGENVTQSESEEEPEEIDDDEVGDGDVSAFLDEAIDEQDSSESSSNEAESSFMQLALTHTKKLNHSNAFKSPAKCMVSAPAAPPTALIDYTSPIRDEAPLLHSVSFYRRQAQEYRTPPVRTIVRKEEVRSMQSPKKNENSAALKQRIKSLQDDVTAQQIIISQTSQALNLCRSSAEFHGSTEQVEGEKLLLIATHKRLASMNEIQRLKSESVLGIPGDDDPTTGSLSMKNIRLVLKKDFLRQSGNGTTGDFVHFFVGLIKYGSQVIATQMLSTKDNISDGMLAFPNLINIRDLKFNFDISLEVYGLQTRRDQVAHDRSRTMSKKEKSRLNLTPLKKLSKSDSKMSSVSVQSPGGPHVVRTSSFALIGYTNINLKTLNRKTWLLEKVPFVSPLDGNLLMTIHCLSDYHVEEKGFLTMFDDVSGFGAWHRRWCVLDGNLLSYWKYPDDEKNRKEPIGSIHLHNCVTANVGLVPRDVCARANTFMLVTIRAPHQDDRETLVCQSFGTYTAIKHLLSADTKEERVMWCVVLNAALSNIRMWDTDALTPFDLNSQGDASDA